MVICLEVEPLFFLVSKKDYFVNLLSNALVWNTIKTQHHRFVDLSLYSVVPYKGIRDIDNTNLFKRECIVLVRKRSMDNKQIVMDL